VSSLLRSPLVAASRRRHRCPGPGPLATRIPRQIPGSIRSAAQNTYRRDPTMPGAIGRQSPAADRPQLLRNQIVMTRVILTGAAGVTNYCGVFSRTRCVTKFTIRTTMIPTRGRGGSGDQSPYARVPV